MIVAQWCAIVAGAALIVWTLGSAIRTVVVPRALIPSLTRFHFIGLRKIFNLFSRPRHTFERRDAALSLYAPTALVTLPGLWVAMVLIGFTAIFWGTGVHPLT